MGFYEENKNYLKIKLFDEIKGMSSQHRLSHYSSIRIEMRERIQKSYQDLYSNRPIPSTSEITKFYKELLRYLGDYELDYILTNLLFEDNFTNICYWLKRNTSLLSIVDQRPIDRLTPKWFLHLYLLKNISFQLRFKEFLIETLSDLTVIPYGHFEMESDVEILHKYPEWIMNGLIDPNKIDDIIFIHLLFVKLWNTIPNYTKLDIASKVAIIFLNNSIKNYKRLTTENMIPNLYLFLSKMEITYDSLFRNSKMIKTPFLDTVERPYYTDGFYIKKEEFLEVVSESEFLSSSLIDHTFIELFERSSNSSSIAKTKFKDTIIDKINKNEYPTEQDIMAISQMTGDEQFNEIRRSFYSKLYLFEYE
jgi:hypothetical protein